MKILCIGDIVGSAGRKMVAKHVPILKEQYQLDLIVAQGENAAHGKGMTRKIYQQLLDVGIDVMTMGNHTFDKPDIYHILPTSNHMVRPMNMNPLGIGKSTLVKEVNNKKVAITNLCGEVFMHEITANPFHCMEDVLEEYKDVDIHIVDFHGEATSEKIAFSYRFAGAVQIIVGTHTHVQTADERIYQGTAAISDLGMCGPYYSVIGRDIDEIITRSTSDEKTRYTMASGPGVFSGVVVEIDDITNQAISIERIQIRPEE